MVANSPQASRDRAAEASELLHGVQELFLPYIRAADEADGGMIRSGHQASNKPIEGFDVANDYTLAALADILQPILPRTGKGNQGLLDAARSILEHSVNTWDPGFLDKLYSSNDPSGLAADLLLSTLNTNTHVYNVSPALTLIEKKTARALAEMYGLHGEHAGGVSLPGGSVTNHMSMLVARNYMFPAIKSEGVASVGSPLAVFTSSASHYSISTAAAQLGIGTRHVHSVRTLPDGRMDVSALRSAVDIALSSGSKPFYVCATSGTTVTGAYDRLPAISKVCKEYGLWMHIDGCYGGAAIFSPELKHLVAGSELADSISLCPHKMLGLPLTTSFLLGADMRKFYHANNPTAGYLFHGTDPGSSTNETSQRVANGDADPLSHLPAWSEVFDMAKFTSQCGRRGDSLKMYLAWQFYGDEGFAQRINNTFAAARQLASVLDRDDRVKILNGSPPPCCQVCFRYIGRSATDRIRSEHDFEYNTRLTRAIVANLKRRGWMTDYSTGDNGEYLRVVCNRNTNERVVENLVKAIIFCGEEALDDIRSS